jgi:hypothetical protein
MGCAVKSLPNCHPPSWCTPLTVDGSVTGPQRHTRSLRIISAITVWHGYDQTVRD